MPATITLGSDPEYFLINEMTMDVVSAIDIGLPGTKEKPEPLPGFDKGSGYNYHADNILAEISVPPAEHYQEASRNLHRAKRALTGLLNQEYGNQYVQMWYNASINECDPEILANPLAQRFGCEPDQDAYEGGVQRPAPDGILGNWRTAGGHVHIGSDQGFNCPNFIVALLCDAFIAYQEPNLFRDEGQGQYWYRKPGLYRDKPYGLEYRTLPNYWTFMDDGWEVYRRAYMVGKYAANTKAADIRELIESIDWIHVRGKIMGLAQKNDAHIQRMIDVFYRFED